MTVKRFLVVFAVFTATRFLFDVFLIPDFIADLADSNFINHRDSVLIAPILSGMLSHSLLFVWLYALVSRNGGSWLLGLVYGVLAALLISLPNALFTYGLIDVPTMNVVWPVIWTVVTNAIGGAVVGFIVEIGAPRDSSISAKPATA